MKPVIIALASLPLLFGLCASADTVEGKIHKEDSFDDLDKDKDGLIDRAEGGSIYHDDAKFEAADVNNDGKLNKDEFHIYIKKYADSDKEEDSSMGRRLLQ